MVGEKKKAEHSLLNLKRSTKATSKMLTSIYCICCLSPNKKAAASGEDASSRAQCHGYSLLSTSLGRDV